jgi:hypothetical protein
MGSTYSFSANSVTLAGATTIALIRPNTTRSIEVLRVELSQSGSATSAQCRVNLCTISSTFPNSMTGATIVPLDDGAATSTISSGTSGSAGTAGVNAGSENGSTKVVLYAAAFNAPIGWAWVPGPDERIVLTASSGNAFAVFFPAAPSSLTGWHCTVVFREL